MQFIHWLLRIAVASYSYGPFSSQPHTILQVATKLASNLLRGISFYNNWLTIEGLVLLVCISGYFDFSRLILFFLIGIYVGSRYLILSSCNILEQLLRYVPPLFGCKRYATQA